MTLDEMQAEMNRHVERLDEALVSLRALIAECKDAERLCRELASNIELPEGK